MKVCMGVGSGAGLAGVPVEPLADAVDRLGFDSLWLPDILTSSGADPLVGLAWVGARHPRLKLGATLQAPGRNPIRLAKQIAALDALSGGRFLVTIVPGLAMGLERDAVGVEPRARSLVIDELLPLLRRLWTGEPVSYDGPLGHFTDVVLNPLPVREPFDIWLGGNAHSSLERCGRLADGWRPGFCTPQEAAAGRKVIEAAAAKAGRTISPEHWGVSLGYTKNPFSEQARAQMAPRLRGREPEDIVATSLDALRRELEEYIAVGFTKFCIRPLEARADWEAGLGELAAAVCDLQT